MHRRSSVALGLGLAFAFVLGALAACGGGGANSAFGGGGGDGGGGGSAHGSGTGGVTVLGSGSGSSTILHGGSGTGSGGGTSGGGCPAGLQCNVACSGGATTTISGKVFDPAGKDPLYGITVYVPANPITPLPKGVPTGADMCSCSALYPSGAVVAQTTAVDGSFTLTNAPVGSSVPLVIQVGKWRHVTQINVTACQDNAQTNGTLKLPGTIPAGETNDNMPDIAVSTGEADTLECLLLRMGVSASEYVPGNSTAGHVHVFSGGDPTAGHFGGGGSVGSPEATPMAGAPSSSSTTDGLWTSQAQLMPYDVVLLSCEGGETYDANPAQLELYLNAGGRAFASHYHYSWFSGPLESVGTNTYTAPADWSTLATWSGAGTGGGGFGTTAVGGVIVTTLNGSTMPFQKGLNLSTWLDENGALGGVSGVSAVELPIYQPRYNALVGPTNTPSQPWITADPSAHETDSTLYFSFDTPVNGGPNYCGRAVFSDLHVSGNPSTADNTSLPPPASCDNVNLSPQEKALEYMLFDLSSCVIPDTAIVSPDAGLPSMAK